jgi:hypothetical protein
MGELKNPNRNEIIRQILLHDPDLKLSELRALSTESLLQIWQQIEIAISKLN